MVVRMKYGVRTEERTGEVAENEMIGMCVLFPISATNFAWIDVCGPMIASTLLFISKSSAALHA